MISRAVHYDAMSAKYNYVVAYANADIQCSLVATEHWTWTLNIKKNIYTIKLLRIQKAPQAEMRYTLSAQ